MNVIATVSNLEDERLIREGEAAVDIYNRSGETSRKQIMPMALGLLAARRKYPANQDFGDWLQTSSYRETGADDRAALIKIGENAEFASKFVRTTALTSSRTIWDAINELMPSSQTAKTVPNPAIDPQPAETAPETVKTQTSSQPQQKNTKTESNAGRKSELSLLPRGKEIAALFLSQKARQTIGRVCRGKTGSVGRQILEMIHLAMDAGLIKPYSGEIVAASIRFLFPLAPISYVKKYDLLKTQDRRFVQEQLLPAMTVCRERLLANPDDMQNILASYEREQRDNVLSKQLTAKREAAIASLRPGECEIVMFGKMLWPRVDDLQGEYDYDQVRAAIWTFRDWETWNRQISGDNGVGSRAIRIRLSTKWFSEYLIRNSRDNPVRKIISLIQFISRLMEASPDAECRWPPYPTSEAEW